MTKSILGDEWAKDEPARLEALKLMQEHPLTYEEFMEQVKQNQEIRKQNMKERQRKENDELTDNMLTIGEK